MTHKYAPNIFCWTIANSAHSDTKQNRGDNLQKKPYLKIKPIAEVFNPNSAQAASRRYALL